MEAAAAAAPHDGLPGSAVSADAGFTEQDAIDQAMSGALGAPQNFAVAEILRLEREVDALMGVRASLTAAVMDLASARAEVDEAVAARARAEYARDAQAAPPCGPPMRQRVSECRYRPPTAERGDATTEAAADIEGYIETARAVRGAQWWRWYVGGWVCVSGGGGGGRARAHAAALTHATRTPALQLQAALECAHVESAAEVVARQQERTEVWRARPPRAAPTPVD